MSEDVVPRNPATHSAVLTAMGADAFASCSNLGNVVLGTNLLSIDNWIFSDCTSLSNITIPPTVTNVVAAAFQGCSNLAAIDVDSNNLAYRSIDGVVFDKNGKTLLLFSFGKNGDYAVPDGVANIGNAAFQHASGLAAIPIPDCVTNIGVEAFEYCPHLAAASLGNGLVNISAAAFRFCIALKEISIPNNVTNLGESAFDSCSSLDKVSLGSGISRIPGEAFHFCTSLQEISIPDGVTSIGGLAFYGCSDLSRAFFGRNVTNIEQLAFEFCNLHSVYFTGNAPTLYDGADWLWRPASKPKRLFIISPARLDGTSTPLWAAPWFGTLKSIRQLLISGGEQTDSASPSGPLPISQSLWKHARIWLPRFGSRSEPTPSPAVFPISATRHGRLLARAFIGCVRHEISPQSS